MRERKGMEREDGDTRVRVGKGMRRNMRKGGRGKRG